MKGYFWVVRDRNGIYSDDVRIYDGNKPKKSKKGDSEWFTFFGSKTRLVATIEADDYKKLFGKIARKGACTKMEWKAKWL